MKPRLCRLLAFSAVLPACGCNTEPPGLAPGAMQVGTSTAASRAALPLPAASAGASSASAPSGGLSASQVARERGVTLVSVEGPRAAAPAALPLVTITKTELLVGAQHVADVNPGPLGFDAAIKRMGQRAALQVMPLDTLLKAVHASSPVDDAQSSVRFLFDRATSYRTALEVIFTASHAGFTSFDFVVEGRAGERTLPARTPSQAEWDAAHVPGAVPPPTFMLQASGVSITIGNDPVGAGCSKGAPGEAVPSLDPAAVAACGARIKAMSPAWGALQIANVSAAGGLDLQTVLAIVAALEPAFPTIHFGMLQG